MAAQSKILAGVRPEGLEDAPQVCSTSTATRRSAHGVSFDAINTALSTALGSAYVNDFPNAGRLQRVIVQADAPDRMQPDDLMQAERDEIQGKPVPMSAFATTGGSPARCRRSATTAIRPWLSGDAAPGYSTGEAMDEMERWPASCRPASPSSGPASRARSASGSTDRVLLAFSMLAVFLCLAALYESWSIPFAVLLAVPLGVLGAVLAR